MTMKTSNYVTSRAWWQQPYVAPIFANDTFMSRMAKASAASHFEPNDPITLAYAQERFDAADRRGVAGC